MPEQARLRDEVLEVASIRFLVMLRTLRKPQCELGEAFLTAEADGAQPMTPPAWVDVLLADPGKRQSIRARLIGTVDSRRMHAYALGALPLKIVQGVNWCCQDV